ncbi:hypothetical protein Tdes44962_MAKER09558 [Teratosphaeria destructans]|uniref:Uncharacterized protein n=1 Tax=Teratosphaeria destructans TaxID=418781 RepID=A0A9W7SST7_9PEZI|nr:hypothetical protein Tdes44962_MAKER09558 [Teratosphaeria destructans]
MSTNGTRLFRSAVLAEIAANTLSLPLMLLYPDRYLRLFVQNPSHINPVSKAVTQWLGGLVLLITLQLAFCYPNPRPSQGGTRDVVPYRRLTYLTLGAGELILSTILGVQYLLGTSGLKPNALLAGVGTLSGIAGVRAWFLYARPSWMEAQENARKAK